MAVVHQELHSPCACFRHFPCSFLYPLLIFLSEEPKRCRYAIITRARSVPAQEEFTPAEMRARSAFPKDTYRVFPHPLQEEVQDILT